MFIVTAKEMYDIDRYTMQEIGLPGSLLMENAGREIFKKVIKMVDKKDRINVFIGAGNNGGDGFVIARYLLEHDYTSSVYQIIPDEKIQGDALTHKQIYLNSGGHVHSLRDIPPEEMVATSDVIIDALLGIGLDGPLRKPYDCVIKSINESASRVISVDIPSGLPADEGVRVEQAVKADTTFLVGAVKQTAYLQETSPYYGKWEVVDIGFSTKTIKRYTKKYHYQLKDVVKSFPKRSSNSHKGDHGQGVIIGGSDTMPGAITMATSAALVAGAGLITAGTIERNIPIIANHTPEAMFKVMKERDGQLTADDALSFQSYDAIAIGVGMGRNESGRELVKQVLSEATCPVLIDADGLYHLTSLLPILERRTGLTVITPHAGEMGRLLELPVEELLNEPFHHTKMFAEKYNTYVVLKGKQTIITSPTGEQTVDTTGNPGLAKGGSGDVLTGITLAMMMQKQPIFHALCNACFIHGTSADLAVKEKHSVYDLSATDLLAWIREVYRMIS